MYLHIGNNDMVLVRNIIGIFDMENLKKSKENKKFISKIAVKDSKENKTLVLINEDGNLKPYYTNISVMTLKKRIEKIII